MLEGLNKIQQILSNKKYLKLYLNQFLKKTRARFDNLLQPYLAWLGYAPYPSTITLFLTNQCNLRCEMCAQWSTQGVGYGWEKAFIDWGVAKKLIDEIAFYRPTLLLMGGEPMLHKDWFKIANYAADLGVPCDIITNGTFLLQYAEKIVRCRLRNLNVSLDGPESVNDTIRHSPGLYKHIIAGIQEVNLWKEKFNSQFPRIAIYFTLTGKNYDRIVELADTLNELNCIDHFQLQHLWFFDEVTYNEHNRIFQKYFGQESSSYAGFIYDPGKIDIKTLLNQLAELRAKKYKFSITVNPPYPDEELFEYYSNPKYQRKSLRKCQLVWINSTIGPNGEVIPCLYYVCGNIQQESILKIWNNKKYRRFRRILSKVERFPICHRCCA